MSTYHTPVMLKEAISYLDIKPNHWYIDCNLGGGGHTEEILKAGGNVLGIDVDPEAIKEVIKKNFPSNRFIPINDNFSHLSHIPQISHISPVSGILFDLGVSSYQLEKPDRGFSFNINAPLDMRMDPNSEVKASDLLNALPEKELSRLFWEYGEENLAKPVAKKIVECRKFKKIETTGELVQIILTIKPRLASDRIHPATKIFQALRIATNDELGNLKEALPQALEVLHPGGRMVVISFHSLEDRIVKNFFKDEKEKGTLKILTPKPVEPTDKEIMFNPRSRSAKLRAAQKLK